MEVQMRYTFVTRALIALALLIGFCLPARAQVDLSGEWAPRMFEEQFERIPGRELGNYLGLPINNAARRRGEAYQGSLLTLPELQCRPMQGDTIWRGPSQVRISKEVDPVTRQITAWHAEWLRSVDRVIYMDGRPHPSPNAPHTWAGFSTGKWDGDVLTITTTHLKEGYIERNGIPRSDLATFVEHWIRHDNWMTVVTIVTDPVYLTEPFILTSDFELDLHQQIPPYPCDIVEEIDRPAGVVPHWLPGTNPDLKEFSDRYRIPYEATMGGAETMYPDYRSKLRTLP
jgi:hypothetical protein